MVAARGLAFVLLSSLCVAQSAPSLYGDGKKPVSPTPVSRSGKYAPLPAPILAAKRVYLVNFSDQPHVLDEAYKALNKWGRYEIVQDVAQADLVLALTVHQTGVVTSEIPLGSDRVDTTVNHGTTYGTIYGGNWRSWSTPTSATSTIQRAPRVSMQRPVGYTTLHVFDAKAGDDAAAIWRVSVPFGHSGKRAVEELKKRVRDQE